MAQLVILFAMQKTWNRVVSIAAEEIRFAWGLEGHLQRLKESLTMIQAKLQDAATRPVTNSSVKLWLERLQDVAYDAENVLEKFENEMRRKNQMNGEARDFFSLHNPVIFRLSMSLKVKKITEALDKILQDVAGLELTFLQHENRAQESAVDIAETTKMNGAMEMKTKTNTHSNLSQENAKSSCKTKTAEWTLLITSLLLEATSAIFVQLRYALTGMVMAFVALLLSILDLIFKAREKGVVEYFGFAGAVWQCFSTTVGYHYTRQNLDNPIKMCLLPLIFALCVLTSKVVKSSQHER